jgi:hypothetical protein
MTINSAQALQLRRNNPLAKLSRAAAVNYRMRSMSSIENMDNNIGTIYFKNTTLLSGRIRVNRRSHAITVEDEHGQHPVRLHDVEQIVIEQDAEEFRAFCGALVRKARITEALIDIGYAKTDGERIIYMHGSVAMGDPPNYTVYWKSEHADISDIYLNGLAPEDAADLVNRMARLNPIE